MTVEFKTVEFKETDLYLPTKQSSTYVKLTPRGFVELQTQVCEDHFHYAKIYSSAATLLAH